ncbi:hypothetical protein [Winogradskyella sp.]|uniref:hypothetical protein n=1 Tax=Winogradskyella sp. TaxID=1883156 RepID=UPI003F6D6BC3
MKKIVVLIIIFLVGISSVNAQLPTCDCKVDLEFIVEKIRKMPSYKKQMKGKKADEFNKTYKELSAQMGEPISIEACYKLLLKQMLLVNDVHAGISVTTEFLSKSVLKDAEKLKSFKNSDIYKYHPKTEKDITNLTAELEQKSSEDLEGIYNYAGKERIGIYYTDNKKDLVGVVLRSELPQWETGEIRFYATHTSGNKYNF